MKVTLLIKRLFTEVGVIDQELTLVEEIILTFVEDGKTVKEAEEGIKMKVVLLKVDSG